jgi:hypothetical protein
VLVDVPSSSDLQRREPRRVFSVCRSDVPTLPRGSRIDAAERSGDVVQAWRVDEPAGADADHVRAIVIPW